METPATHWFLRKHEDGEIFGPLPFEQLALWASTAQIAPHDSISNDQLTWIKAPMLPELGMDWLVEVTSERYYGPTTLGAIQEFMRLGEINEENYVINSCDGTRQPIQQIMPLLDAYAAAAEAQSAAWAAEAAREEPMPSGMAIEMQDRIRELEQTLREERRSLVEAEERYRALEAKYREVAGSNAII